jgi:hypothetical protein
MPKDIVFEELDEKERILLLRAFDYDIDSEGFVLKPDGSRIRSKENPSTFIKVNDSALITGSLKVLDGTPIAISKFIRERVEKSDDSRD